MSRHTSSCENLYSPRTPLEHQHKTRGYAGLLPGAPALSIDHLAHTLDLESVGMGIWPMRDEENDPLSDHFGLWCDFGLSAPICTVR